MKNNTYRSKTGAWLAIVTIAVCAVLYLPLIFISFSWGALIILLVFTYFICDV